MSKKRKAIPNSVRFEVFKRDSFKCQYCGRSAPDVILEIEHITPVAKGGTNEIINLLTACKECNSGKGARLLSDDAVITKQKQQLDDINERRAQLELMSKWKTELINTLENEVDMINDALLEMTNNRLTEHGRANLRKEISRFGYAKILEGLATAFESYYDGTEKSVSIMLDKLSGIIINSDKRATDAQYEHKRHIKNSLKYGLGEPRYIWELNDILDAYCTTDDDYKYILSVARKARSYWSFYNTIKSEYEV